MNPDVLNPHAATTRWPFRAITKSPDARLSPCPFCGAAAEIGHRPTHGQFFVMCSNRGCGCYLAKHSNKAFLSDEAAVAAWNRRT